VIIKLIPIKTKTRLSSVIQYIATDKGRIEDHKVQGVFHNVKSRELTDIQNEFEHNYNEYASKRSNGNMALHGIISLHPNESEKVDLETMDDITSTLLENAYPHALGFGTHHLSENHRHSHFIVSANDLMSKTSTRLSRQRLFEVHKGMIEYVKGKHPEIKVSIDISQWGRKLNNEKDYYMKKRNSDLILQKEALREKINEFLTYSRSSKEFYALLEFEGIKTYSRNDKVQGILFGENDQKIRLSRLGVEQEFLDLKDKLNERLEEIGNKDPYAKDEILSYALRQTDQDIIEQLQRHEAFEWLKELPLDEGRDLQNSLATDHYTYDQNDTSGNPTGIKSDFILEHENDQKLLEKEAEQDLDNEFARIMNLPVHEETKEIEKDQGSVNEWHADGNKEVEKVNKKIDVDLPTEDELAGSAERQEEVKQWEIEEFERLREIGEFDKWEQEMEFRQLENEQDLRNDLSDMNSENDVDQGDGLEDMDEDIELENDIDELDNETDNDIDADNDMDMDSEP